MGKNTANQCGLSLFQDSDFAGDLVDSNRDQQEHCAFLEITFVPMSCTCKKQTSVSCSSTESEIISSDVELRMYDIPALDFLIVAVLHRNTYQSNQKRKHPYTNLVRVKSHKLPIRNKSHGMFDEIHIIDFNSSKMHSSRQEALLYIFENNEPAIKMIIKGRSPTMRHLPRSRRVTLDWVFDGINLDSMI